MALLAELERYNPLKRPDWRYRRVLSIIQGKSSRGSSRVFDDRWIKGYRRFLVTYNRPGKQSRLRAFKSDPALYYAHRLYHEPDKEWRSILEARILANETPESIAKCFHTIPETVDWYEKIFFDVRDRLGSRDWIIKVIRQGVDLTLDDAGDVADDIKFFTYKFFGYFGGPWALDVIIAGVGEVGGPRSYDEVNSWLQEVIVSGLTRKGAIASQLIGVNNFTASGLLRAYATVLKEKGDGLGDEHVDIYRQHLEALREQIEYRKLGVKGDSELKMSPIFNGLKDGKTD